MKSAISKCIWTGRPHALPCPLHRAQIIQQFSAFGRVRFDCCSALQRPDAPRLVFAVIVTIIPCIESKQSTTNKQELSVRAQCKAQIARLNEVLHSSVQVPLRIFGEPVSSSLQQQGQLLLITHAAGLLSRDFFHIGVELQPFLFRLSSCSGSAPLGQLGAEVALPRTQQLQLAEIHKSERILSRITINYVIKAKHRRTNLKSSCTMC